MAALLVICLFLVLLLPLIVLFKLWWIPLHLQHSMEAQGIKVPSYKFIHGSTKEIIKINKQLSEYAPMELSHDTLPRIHPHFYSWMKLYGNNFRLKRFWATKKDMIPSMIASVETMLERWKHYEGKGIDVCGPFRVLRSEVISRTAFGSSYVEGGQIFDLLTKLSALISRTTHNIRLPGVRRILRNKDDIEAEKIEQLLHDSIMKIVKKRQDEEKSGQENNFGSDYLGSLLKARDPNKQLSAVEIIDECKTFYFAGQETTCGLLSRGMLLLAIHADWQEKARSEVLELFVKYDNI